MDSCFSQLPGVHRTQAESVQQKAVSVNTRPPCYSEATRLLGWTIIGLYNTSTKVNSLHRSLSECFPRVSSVYRSNRFSPFRCVCYEDGDEGDVDVKYFFLYDKNDVPFFIVVSRQVSLTIGAKN